MAIEGHGLTDLESADRATASAAAPPLPRSTAIIALLAQGALFTAAGVGLWIVSGRPAAEFVSVSAMEIALGVGFGALLIAIAATSFRLFPRMSEHLIRLQSDTYRFLGRDLGWPAIVAISLVAGISEEAALRAGLQTILGDHLGIPAAIGLASAAFAALHLAKPLILALLFVIGVAFGVVYWQSGSLLAVMIAHVIYDIWALRYLNREMHRLGLFEEPPPPLAKEPLPS